MALSEGSVVLVAAGAALELQGAGLVFVAGCHPSFEA
jgi:hypothetical protein